MSKRSHLSDDVLVLITMRELPKTARQEAADHLRQCVSCRERLRGYLSVRRNMEQLGEEELRTLASGSEDRRPKAGSSAAKVVGFAGSAVLSVLLVVVCYLALVKPRAVSADELLTRATAHEYSIAAPKRYNMRMGKTNCVSGDGTQRRVSVKSSDACESVHRALIDGKWNLERPMAPKSFQDWRRSLRDHRDVITQDERVWNLRTETDSGNLRAASIRIRKSDYSPQEVTIEYVGMEPISIEEAPLPEAPVLVADLGDTVQKLAKPSIAIVADPLDTREVHAWTILHKLGADSGWEATVIRQSDRVIVGGLVADATRQKEIESAMAQVDPQIEIDLHTTASATASDRSLFPERQLGATAPPLAEDWLEQHFPAPSERSAYSSHVSELSRSLLGQIFLYSKLNSRYQVLHACPCAKDLEPDLLAQRERIASLQQELASTLAPVIGDQAIHKPVRLLTYPQAMELDRLVRNTFTAQAESSTSLPEALDGLRLGLSKP